MDNDNKEFIKTFLANIHYAWYEDNKWKSFFIKLKSCGALPFIDMRDVRPEIKRQRHLLITYQFKENDAREFEMCFQNKHLHVRIFGEWFNTYNNQTLIINLLKNQLFKK